MNRSTFNSMNCRNSMQTLIVLCCLAISMSLAAQELPVMYGKVLDQKTGEPLAGATVKFKDASGNVVRGVRTNRDGVYRAPLPLGRYTAEVSYIGYRTKEELVAIALSVEKNFMLTEGEITATEIVVDAGEDLVTTIMKRAIRFKKKQREALESYELEAYAKRLTRSDTSIAGITETFAKAYWRKGDTLREVIIQERITENIKAQLQQSSIITAGVGSIVDFSEERIPLGGSRFISPIANDAFDNYGFELLETTKIGNAEIYRIKLKPKNKLLPLFNGTIKVGGNTYALISVDLTPNQGFKVPYVKGLTARYKQDQDLHRDSSGHEFWLPATQFLDFSAQVSIAGGFIELPKISFTQTTAVYGYKINQPLADTLFQRKRFTKSESAAKFDSSFWREREFVALSDEEQTAYKTLDSSKTLQSQFQPRGAGMTLAGGAAARSNGIGDLLTNLPDVRYNRVEGFFLGGKLSLDSVTATTALRGSIGYGLDRREWLWTAGATQWLDKDRRFGIGIDAYRTTSYTPEYAPLHPLSNAALGLIDHIDSHNYFNGEGYKISATYRPNPRFDITLSFRNEMQRSMDAVAGHNWFPFYTRRQFRPNPLVQDGMMRSLAVEANVGNFIATIVGNFFPPIFSQPIVFVQAEHSSAALGSAFDFTRLWAVGSVRIKSFFTERFLSPYFTIQAELGTSFGSALPPQRYYSMEWRAFFGVDAKEFLGTSIALLMVEHNFQSVPFEALGLDWIAEQNIQLIARAGAGSVWLDESRQIYWETGLGVGGILGLFRVDGFFGFRENRSPRFGFTLGVALLL